MTAERPITFAEHIQELRKRLMWSLLFVGLGAGIGYALHNTLLGILQQPLHEKLYYTTPTGAFSFIIKICTVFGIIVSVPAVLYHSFAFFQPLITIRIKRVVAGYVFLSVVLAVMGVAFAYFVSLPAALKFLVNFGSAGGIESLITANEYFNFVLAYITGFAVLFQLPLIVTFINRITPLTPSKLIASTRYVVLGSFIIAAIITPTPDPFNQILMAGPVILLYFLSGCAVAFINFRAHRRSHKARAVVPAIDPVAISALTEAEPPPANALISAPEPASAAAPRKPSVISDMVIPRRNVAVPAYRPRNLQTNPSQPARAARPAMRMISDFLPVAD